MLTKLRPAAETFGMVRVLLLDRSPDDVRNVREVLQGEGRFRVFAARDVEDARIMLDHGQFDVAVVDFETWADTESAFFEALNESHPDLAVVLLTGDTDERDALEAMKRGANDFIAREMIAAEKGLASRILAAVEESRTMRRRDTMVRWLEREALTDHLTGLHNKRAFDERLKQVCEASNSRGAPLALIVMDIAQTQIVNEVHGTDAGDSMIRRTAAAVAGCIRGTDFAARIGGDDFGVIIPEGDIDLGRLIARRIAQQIERMNGGEWDGDIPVSVTFGVASAIGCDSETLLAAAIQQLSDFKSERRGGSVVWLRSQEDGPSVA